MHEFCEDERLSFDLLVTVLAGRQVLCKLLGVRKLLLASACFALVSVSCSAAPNQPVETVTRQTYPLPASGEVAVRFEHGTLSVQSSPGDEVTLQATGPYQVEQTDGGLRVEAEGSHHIAMQMTVPGNSSLQIESFDGDVSLTQVGGEITVRSTAGNIMAEELAGSVQLITGRGDITVTDTTGEVSLLGEHGTLSMNDVHGESTAISIMGTVHYTGPIAAGDDIRLETDHGPVEVWLSQDANATVKIASTNGLITCRLGTLVGSMSRCSGQIGAGEGTLSIRTVSGSVSLAPEYEITQE